MYSRKSWGGNTDPFILTRFTQDPEAAESDPLVSLVIFEWSDEELIGRSISDDPEVRLSSWNSRIESSRMK